MAEVLRATSVVAGHGGIAVVRDLSMTVEEGETVVLLGPNGAGKTTTLRTISGLLPLLGGSIAVMGTTIEHMRPHQIARSGVAHVLEDRSLFLQLTVEENLRLGASTADALTRGLELFPPLRELLRRRAGLLSGGEQQMLALARALAGEPRLLMIDEMSLGLAPVVVSRLMGIVRRYASEHRCGVLLVEQHVAAALEVADTAYVLSHGDLIACGPAAAVASDLGTIQAGYLGRR
jgi:branched-chain amino acid transport system ATP-binding protein